METSAFDFDLPDDLIAQQPVEPRDRARLMVVRRAEGRIEHRIFADLPDLLDPRDVLARNNTRVVPARLVGWREATGGRWEGLFLRVLPAGTWEILATTRGKPAVGEAVVVAPNEPDPGRGTNPTPAADRPQVDGPFGSEGVAPNEPSGGVRHLRLRLVERREGGRWEVRPETPGAATDLLGEFGMVPLPPYIRRGREGPGDRLRYQTVYAEVPGAVAAPTAGLHFTEGVFRGLEARGIDVVDLTLHVGIGTFRPIEAARIEDHTLHAEYAELPAVAAERLNARRAAGGRIVAIGTTSARTLETAARGGGGLLRPFAGETALYLRPGHEFRGLDALLTNFHLPRSSLIVLVSALAGVELTRAAYAEAIRERYRFYSYGDAMLVL